MTQMRSNLIDKFKMHKKKVSLSLVGLEPTASGLEVQRAIHCATVTDSCSQNTCSNFQNTWFRTKRVYFSALGACVLWTQWTLCYLLNKPWAILHSKDGMYMIMALSRNTIWIYFDIIYYHLVSFSVSKSVCAYVYLSELNWMSQWISEYCTSNGSFGATRL